MVALDSNGVDVTKLKYIINVKKSGGVHSKSAKLLKFFETKGEVRKEEVEAQYSIAFDGLIKDGSIEPANEKGYYELSDKGIDEIKTYKKFHKLAYKNLKL